MATVRLESAGIADWESFHDVCAATFGFPEFYGRNLNAWIDCMTSLDDGMTRFDLPPGEVLTIEVVDWDDFERRAREVADALAECVAFANERRAAAGEPPRLRLIRG